MPLETPHASAALGRPRRIGSVAKQLGISASMIRAWEHLGLRRGPARAGEHRLYDEQDVQLLQRAVHLRKVEGLNAPAIILQLRRDGLLNPSEPPTGGTTPRSIGDLLRALRLERGQSLAEVAASVDISPGFLSNLERSQTGVSLGIMHRLAHHYGTTLSQFLYQADSPGPLIKKGEGRHLAGGDGVNMELLAWGRVVMEPHLFVIAPGKGSLEYYSHPGEEFIYVVAGMLDIKLGEQRYSLREGDSFYFESKLRHSWSNPGTLDAKLLWINTSAMI